ncbi:hypothetical protein BD410DRAFT_700563, partial [Rickenella mellea]
TSRAKVGDYDAESKELILAAIQLFRCAVSTEKPFPDKVQEVAMAKDAWMIALKDHDAEYIKPTTEVIKLITRRAPQVRGELKTKVRPLVAVMYGFEDSYKNGTARKNAELVDELKEEYAFVYKVFFSSDTPASGLYQHPILQKVINLMWFANKSDEGIAHPEYFTPFPAKALALVATVIECCLDEWASGTRVDVPFTSTAYSSVFSAH